MSEARRAAIVAEARSWRGTPYHPGADVKGVGVDCGMLIVRTFVDTGCCPAFDPRPYPHDWHLHRSEERYLGFVLENCVELASGEEPAPADVVVFRFGRCWSHGGVVTGVAPLMLVHAFAPSGCVVEDVLATNAQLSPARREPRFFRAHTLIP